MNRCSRNEYERDAGAHQTLGDSRSRARYCPRIFALLSIIGVLGLFVPGAGATLILFPGTAVERPDTDGDGVIVVADVITIPGTGLTFTGEARVDKGPSSILLKVTGIITNTTDQEVQDERLWVMDTHDFAGTAPKAGKLAVIGLGTLFDTNNDDVSVLDELQLTSNAPAFVVTPVTERDSLANHPTDQRLDLNKVTPGTYNSLQGDFEGFIKVRLGPNDGITLTNSADFLGAVVPQPATIIYVSIGLVSLLGYGWRRRR